MEVGSGGLDRELSPGFQPRVSTLGTNPGNQPIGVRSLLRLSRASKRFLRADDCLIRFNQKSTACIGQAHRYTALSLKKLDSKFIFQSSNLTAQRWQAHVQTLGGTAEGQFFGNSDE
jgi:hypothetical protein